MPHPRRRVRLLLLILPLTLHAAGCGSDRAPGEATSILVRPEEVGAYGCLNLERLFRRVENFPADVAGRIHTRDLEFSSPAGTRAPFLHLVARGSFKFSEKPVRELVRYSLNVPFEKARQPNCASATLVDREGGETTYEITRASDSHLRLEKVSSEPGPTLVFEFSLLSLQSVELRAVYPAIDVCRNEAKVLVDAREVLSWHQPDVGWAAPSEAPVSLRLLRSLLNSAVTPPAALLALVSDAPPEAKGESLVQAPTSALAELRDAEIPLELLACAPPPPPPREEEEEEEDGGDAPPPTEGPIPVPDETPR